MSTSVITTPAVDTDAVRSLIENTLDAFFTSSIKRAQKIDPHYAQLWKTMYTLIRAGGKRLRPQMTLLTYATLSGKDPAIVAPVASALELLHLAMLIHDDIIDRDYIRYGVDNVSGQYDKLYKDFIPDALNRRHFSDSAAIIAGDLLIAGGYQLISSSNLKAKDIAYALAAYSEAIFTVVGGELLDTESTFRPIDSIQSVKISYYKTAHYSFVTPIVLGAQLSGAPEETLQALTRFAEQVGIGFQIVDDVLGVFGDESVTGKSACHDISEGKHTYLVEQFYEKATPEQAQQFNAFFGQKNTSEEDSNTVRRLLLDTGAKQQAEEIAQTYKLQALEVLDEIDLNPRARVVFETIAERAINRTK